MNWVADANNQGCWRAKTFNKQQWIQAMFPFRMSVTAVQTRGAPGSVQWIKSYRVLYGDNEHSLTAVKDITGSDMVSKFHILLVFHK